MSVLIQFRRDTAAAWSAVNPTLATGEMGLETDTNQFKIGNGSTAWNSLPYGGIVGPTGATGPTGLPGDKYSTVSSTSLTIGLGPQTFTVATGLAYSINQDVVIAYDSSNDMNGPVTSYNSGTGQMTVNVIGTNGSGTYSSWTVNLDGAVGSPGATGPQGATGPMPNTLALTDLIPALDDTYSLGNSTNKWNNLYLAGNTIYLGDAVLSADGTTLVVDNLSVTSSNIGNIGNVAALNLNGNASSVLLGDGNFAAVPGLGNVGAANFDGNASNVLLGSGSFGGIPYPTQTGQTGNVLKTDGTTASWGNITFEAMVYVSKSGSDSTGDGSINKPFLTLTAAQNAITDNTPSKRYAIMVAPGLYTETGSFGIKRNVFIIGSSLYLTRLAATSFVMNEDFNRPTNEDDRSGFLNCTLNNACDFNWTTVSSLGGKLFFENCSFNSTFSVYGGTNATAQGRIFNCVFFGAFTNSGINLGIINNCVFYSTITMTQHPNGGMATICAINGGYAQGLVTLNATVSDFNRRCSLFARSFWMGGGLTINGPSAYADCTADSLNGTPTITNSGNLVNLNPNILANPTNTPILPLNTNSTNFGDWGKQWFWSFAYVHASTGTDCFLISYPSSFGAASVGANVGISADGAGLQENVNGGNISLSTATASGTGIRGQIILNARQINASNVKIVNVANATSSNDAVNLSQLDSVSANSKVLSATTTTDLSAVANAINTTGKVTGLMVFNTTDNLIYVAGGSLAADNWYPSNGGTAITPA